MQRSAILRCIFRSVQLCGENNVGYAIKSTGFRKKSGAFLLFEKEMDPKFHGTGRQTSAIGSTMDNLCVFQYIN